MSRRLLKSGRQAGGEIGEILTRPVGTILLAGVFLIAGLAGFVAFWAAWPRTADTSPLAALFALLRSFAYVGSGVLIWRRSRLAAPAFLAAIGLLVFPAFFLVPGSQLFLPSLVVMILFAFLGYRYLRKVRERAA